MLAAEGVLALGEHFFDRFRLPAQHIVVVLVQVDDLLEVLLAALHAVDQTLIDDLLVVESLLSRHCFLSLGCLCDKLVDLAHEATLCLLRLLVRVFDF